MRKMTACGLACAAALIMGDSCDDNSSTRVEQRQQESMTKQANQSVGMPAIVRFSEKQILKDILELRDKMTPTTTYIVDMGGHLHKICNSMGFGIPYATQFTNPEQDIFNTTNSSMHMSLPQADPNGLYLPASADGTWVLCVNPATQKAVPMYIDPRIIVSPFPLDLVQ